MSKETIEAAKKVSQGADVGASRIAKVYAQSLYDAAPKGEATNVDEEFSTLVNEVFQKEPNLEKVFSSGSIAPERKADLLKKVFGGKLSSTFNNFLMIVNHHGRLDLLRSIHASYQSLLEEKQKRIRVYVQSAVPLETDQRTKLISTLQGVFQQEPVLQEIVNPELLGGFIVRVGDWQFDASVLSKLGSIRKQLVEKSSHEIQGRRDRFCTV